MSKIDDYNVLYGFVNYHGKNVMDIGADYGKTAKFFLSRGAKHVVAVEKKPRHFKRLKEYADKRGNITPIHLEVLTVEHWTNLITEYGPDVLQSDCEGCERSLINVSPKVFRLVPEYLLAVHGQDLIDRYLLELPQRGYDIVNVNPWAKEKETVIYASKRGNWEMSRFQRRYEQNLKRLQANPGSYRVFRRFYDDTSNHPHNHIDHECTFASRQIAEFKPKTILDISSWRHFILGLLGHYKVTSLDVRERLISHPNERQIVCDAKKLPLPDESQDMVVSLCALHHMGLGRYGDKFDLDADKKAFSEMRRVLRPGGRIVFTTLIARGQPSICFNAHRIYSHDMIREFCRGMTLIEEGVAGTRTFSTITNVPMMWNVYCGCWEKT